MPLPSKQSLPNAGFVLAVLSGFALAVPGHAQILYQTGFEAPGFTAGQPINGQSGWTAPSGLPSSPQSGMISTAAPASGNQSLQIVNSTLDYDSGAGLYVGRYQSGFSFTATAQSIFLVQAAVRLDGPNSGADLSSANLFVGDNFVGGGSEEMGEIYASSSGNIFSDNGPTYADATPAYTLGRYATLGLKLDFTDLTESYYVNGSLIDSLPMPSDSLTNRTFSVFLFGLGSPDGGTYNHSSYTDDFDDLSVSSVSAPVPEASTTVSFVLLLALGTGGMVVAARRKRGRRGRPGHEWPG